MSFRQSGLWRQLVGTGVLLFAGLGAAPVAEHRQTLARTEDFVVFTGADAPALLGAKTTDLHLYSCRSASWLLPPFQVDKRDAEGRYVFPDEKLRDPRRDGDRLDVDDELVFMVRDAGDRCPDFSAVEAWTQGAEIALTDPVDGGQAWVYLFAQPGVKLPPTPDYVSYRLENGEEYIGSDHYEVGRPLGKNYDDYLRLRRPNRQWGLDVVDHTQVGLQARLVYDAIPVNIPEGQIRVLNLGLIDGPVRVIEDKVAVVGVPVLGINWRSEFFRASYANGYVSRSEFPVPVNTRGALLEFHLYWGIAFNSNMLGAAFGSPTNPPGVVLDGRPDPQLEKQLDNACQWVNGPQGGLINAMVFHGELGQYLTRTTLVVEDARRPSGADPAGPLLVGFLVKSRHVPKGLYYHTLYNYFPVPFAENKPEEILRMIYQPVHLAARPLSPAASAVSAD